MTVHRDPADVALHEIASLLTAGPDGTAGMLIRLVSLWQVVEIGARARGDDALADLATAERRHFGAAISRLRDPPR